MKPPALRALPSVDRLVRTADPSPLPRALVTRCAREVLARARTARTTPGPDQVADAFRNALAHLVHSRLTRVINATGIVAHTNLGRAPIAEEAVVTLGQIASGYCNLEFDLARGMRGSRAQYLELCLAELCGAPAATVVNNCAAALVLILHHLTRGPRKEVVISRGELVQIGGGFRIPEILAATGARLSEVGTTNRTSIDDYASRITRQTALVLRVHRSNFVMQGFVETPELPGLAGLCKRRGVPLVDDLGSGAVWNTDLVPGAEAEPQPRESLRAGSSLVAFSGDKLLGGPQAGIIAGSKRLVTALKSDPLYRALRCDKLTLAALQTTVEMHLGSLHRQGVQPSSKVPVPALLHVEPVKLQLRAERLLEQLLDWPGVVRVEPATSQVGGGVAPCSAVPSVALALRHSTLGPDQLAQLLRLSQPPVVGMVTGGTLRLDLRTVLPLQDDLLLAALKDITRASSTPRSPR